MISLAVAQQLQPGRGGREAIPPRTVRYVSPTPLRLT